MYTNKEKLFKIGIQFFAEEGGEGDEGNQNQQNQQQNQNQNQNNQQNQGKTFTQEELNAVAANEKKTARQAIFKALGVEVKDGDFEAATKQVKDILDAGKTQAQKDAEAKKAAEEAKTQAETKNKVLQAKVEVLSAGVTKDFVDDAITMLLPKITEEKPLSKLLEEYKTKYPNWFGSSSGSQGTGGSLNPPRGKGGNGESLGQRLAKGSKSAAKSSYFK